MPVLYEAPKPKPSERSAPQRVVKLENVRYVIAVASGKGGVGKSTTAVNVAVALGLLGLKVGLLDADIYGPSLPRLLGLRDKPELNEDKKILPPERHGVRAMSIGLLLPEENAPLVWRGPMAQGALVQMLRDVAWGALDVLMVDMPPGTGDIQLTMAQQVSLAGAVIVSTPQDLALQDARKAIGMFGKMEVPILGIVENMSSFLCPHCGKDSPIFGHGGARQEAERINVPFLGEIPLDLSIRETSDAGTPIVMAHPESSQARGYLDVARRLVEGLR